MMPFLARGLLAVAMSASTAQAQRASDSLVNVASAGSVLTRRDAITLGAFALGVAVALPNDRHVADEFQRQGVQDNAALRDGAAFFRAVGEPGVLLGGVSAWVIGRLSHRPSLARSGLHVTEAIVVTGVLTSAFKIAVGRARPPVAKDGDPYDFAWWRGTRNGYTSMPSGHTSAAFAAASALAGEWRARSPASARYVVPGLYAGATLVGLSRIYHDRHWTSDVVAGAALGTLAGAAVGRWGRRHPDNPVQRWLAPLSVTPAPGGGLKVGFSLLLNSPDERRLSGGFP